MTDDSIAAQAAALFQEGLALHHQGKLESAKEIYDRVLQLQPQHFEALHLQGVIAALSKNPGLGVTLIQQSLAINPANATAWCNLGNALSDMERFSEAIESYDKAIALKPSYSVAHNGLGTALKKSMQYFAAIDSYSRAIVINAGYADAYANRGLAFVEVNQYHNALASIDQALALKPGDSAILQIREMVLGKSIQHQEIIGTYVDKGDASVTIAAFYFMQGKEAIKNKQYQKALACFDELIAINLIDEFAYLCRGNTLLESHNYKAAIDSYDRALACKPDFADALFNCGKALNLIKDYEGAIKSLEKVLIIDPKYEYLLHGFLQFWRMGICDWTDFDNRIKALSARIERGEKASEPFSVVVLTNSLPLQRKAAQIYASVMWPRQHDLPQVAKYEGHQKIRIAYFSADLFNHATAHLMAGLFELHDRSKFEIIAFSFSPKSDDNVQKRLLLAFDQFIDINDKSDLEAAQLCRSLEVDIAVDLKGYTANRRTGIFEHQAAPLQVNFLGYLGTMGVDYIDYLIADKMLIPNDNQQFYTEKIVYLPNSYQVNDRHRQISEKIFTRSELGLPEVGFIFCCFNNNYKITPHMFDVWMRLLKRVDGSVLWLLEDNAIAASNLRLEAQQRGVNPDRLVFAPRMPLQDHLARHRAADLFLDTLPYNAHTTASDALWAGLPVLTCLGESFAGRVAASLLSALELNELITPTMQAYEALAFELANVPARLDQIKQKLSQARLTKPLFDTGLYTQHIEAAYTAMYQRHQADLPPDHIFV